MIFSALAYAADPREAQIAAAQASYWNCWGVDSECLSRLVTDDFVQILGSGKRRDKAEFLAAMKAGTFSKGVPSPGTLTASSVAPDLFIRFYGDTAVVTWLSARRGEIGTYVWVAPDGKSWRMANHQITPLQVGTGAPNPDTSKAEKEVAAAMDAWKQAMVKGDAAALDKLYHKDLTYAHSSAKNENKAEAIESATKAGSVAKGIDLHGTTTRIYGNTALVKGTGDFTNATGGVTHLDFLMVWLKDAQGWQLVARQSTKLP